MNPVTIEEWVAYIDGLSDEQLLRQVKAINSMDGIKVLQKTLSAEEIEDLLGVIAVTFNERDIAIPKRYEGEYLNLETILGV